MSSESRPCPRCAAPLPPPARFCPACGFALSRLSPGQVLDGKYEILDKVGEGGMGEVYRARHLHLDEIRIIKVTKPQVASDEESARRFQAEARLATLVRHPNVAALYDFSRQPDGSFYMVWEFIDGVTLQEWLRKNGPLDLGNGLAVARQVLAGLSEIHAQGIVHRDLSPDNIMLRRTAAGLQAKIIDLGIAKRVEAGSVAMTGTGLFLGKLKYCSPEQAGALAAGEALDARTDIYSFGVVLYEMLSGRAPFESATPEGYIGKHLHTAPPPLDVSALPPSAGPTVAAIVARTLDKKRDRRYATARDLADALGAVPAEAAARPPTPDVPADGAAPRSPGSRGARTRAAAIVLGALLLAAAAVLVARRTGGGGPHAPARRSAVSPRPRAAAGTPAASEAAPAATPAAPPTPPAGSEAAPPSGPTPGPIVSLPPEEALRRIAVWESRPNEPRARLAAEIAQMANRVAAAHPDDPAVAEMRRSLPAFLRTRAAASLDHAEPLLARLYFFAYRALDFAPPDPELERRLERFAASRPADGRRPPQTPRPDGR